MPPRKYLITYTLKTPGWNYTGFFTALQSLGTWWHYLDSTWIIKNSIYTPQQMHAILGPHLSRNDFILIVEIVPGNKNGWLPPEAWRWIDS